MSCELCGRAVQVRLVSVVNGAKTEHHLCDACAERRDTVEPTIPSIPELAPSAKLVESWRQNLRAQIHEALRGLRRSG